MMFNKMICFVLIIVSIVPVVTATTAIAEQSDKKVLIIYDTKAEIGAVNDRVFALKNLIYHFNVQVIAKHHSQVNEYDLANFDVIFILNNSNNINQKMYESLKQSTALICYIGSGIKEFSEELNIPITVKDNKYDFTNIVYDSGRVIKNNRPRFGGINYYFPVKDIQIQSPDIKVYAGLSNGSSFNPIYMRYKNIWIMSVLEFYGDMYLVFADLLHQVIEEHNATQTNVFIRIEDVHPFRDQTELRAIADYLYTEKVPFMVALIPAFKNKDTDKITHMQDVEGFVDTIKYMVNKGASVVMHGYTHAGYGEVSGEGYEFWDGINNTPIKDVIEAEYIEEKIYLGVKTCVANGIYPLAFEPPHYAMSSSGYKQVSLYFSTFCGQLQASDISFTTIKFPYLLKNTDSYTTVLPENLGYISGNRSEAVSKIKENFYSQTRVKDYFGGMFFHPNIELSYLKQLVEFFKQEDISFYDLKQHKNWVKTRDIKIESANGVITVESDINSKSVNKYFAYVNMFLMSILSLVLFILVIVFLRFKQLNKLRFLKGIENEAKLD